MTTTSFIDGQGDMSDALIVVFLRGGADALNIAAPIEDDGYFFARAQTGMGAVEALRLDDIFALHPLLKGLHELYQEGDLLLLQGAGSEDETRSHFEAQDYMEHGGLAAGGWLGRYLRVSAGASGNALAAVALAKTQPECLRGAPGCLVMESLDALSFGEATSSFLDTILPLYESAYDAIGRAGVQAADGMRRLAALHGRPYQPDNAVAYPQTQFSAGLQQIAQLLKSGVGLRAATIDLEGWDSHFATATLMNPLLQTLNDGLLAFSRDLGPERLSRTTIVVMSEFGRRVYENASFGTDHGRGGLMMVLGGGIAGGRILHQWQGFSEDVLEPPGDLPVAYNYRDVLAPILQRQHAAINLSDVFPSYAFQPVPVYG